MEEVSLVLQEDVCLIEKELKDVGHVGPLLGMNAGLA